MTRTARKGRKRHLESTPWEELCGDGEEDTTDGRGDTVEEFNQVCEEPKKKKKSKKAKLNNRESHEDKSSYVETTKETSSRVEEHGLSQASDSQCRSTLDNPSQKRQRETAVKKKRQRRGVVPDEEVSEKRVKRREHRRMRRARMKVCFKCRGWGHRLQDCPKRTDSTGICFKCGSTEHTSHQCQANVPDGKFPFAKCFICGETGHLSSSCPDNPKGLYPRGGGCKVCGSVEHLRVNCPKLKETCEAVATEGTLTRSTPTGSADADHVPSIVTKKLKPKSKTRVVKF